LQHLYELQLLLWIAQRSSLPTLLPNFTTATSATLGAASSALDHAHRRAYQLLHDTCGDCSGEAARRLWHAILSTVSSLQPVVPIFTLNYDWTFEKLVIEKMERYELVDGFELLGGTWDARRFNKLKPVADKINIALFKLHGSTNWLGGGPTKSLGHFPSDDHHHYSQYPPYGFEMVYPGHEHEKWFGKEDWHDINPLVGDSWDKREPYETLHNYLNQVTGNARLIVVVGYSFHDKRVNAQVAEVVNGNERTQVLVVDPGSERYVKATDSKHWTPPFDWLQFDRFGFECRWSQFVWLQGRFGERRTTKGIVDAVRGI
jgi:hypothetical protein